jgi:hypothetical protein
MGKIRRSTLLGLTLLLMFVAGCKVSCTTANVSSLKLSKDKEGNIQTKEFAPGDTVYATATVSNNASKVTLKFRLVTEKVEGKPDNTLVAGSEVSVDVPASGDASYHVTIPPSGFPAGRYRVEVAMLYNDEQKDKKSDTFTVKGGGDATAPRPAAPQSAPAGSDTPAEGDESDSENSNTHGEH